MTTEQLKTEESELEQAAQDALYALESAMDNLRDHGDNCFLLDEGEYASCFCGKDSLVNFMQSTVEALEVALNRRTGATHEQ